MLPVTVCACTRESKADAIHFDEQHPERPVSADWVSKSGSKGSIRFDWLVDASRNVACWAYWTGGGAYAPGTTRENAPWFEALTDETGWSWYIPLHDGTVSVGFVTTKESSTLKRANIRLASKDSAMNHSAYLKQHYLD